MVQRGGGGKDFARGRGDRIIEGRQNMCVGSWWSWGTSSIEITEGGQQHSHEAIGLLPGAGVRYRAECPLSVKLMSDHFVWVLSSIAEPGRCPP